ncbi:MAG: phosphodiester glycosidase family protein [Acidobacteriota bacterium]|nr:MAG: phosphodiester glycosidase family protein [Acidobacteriota bacterium]
MGRRRIGGLGCRLGAVVGAALFACATPEPIAWRELAAGLEYATMSLDGRASGPDANGSATLHVVRIDPAHVELRALMASQLDGKRRTAGQWCDEFGLKAAINMGMYQADYRSNVGYARSGDHVNNGHWASKYKSAIGFRPQHEGLAPARMVDLDGDADKQALDGYATVIQNLRLIRAPGRNVWSQQDKRWSEAAIATDAEGRVLLLFIREPFSMWELNHRLLALPLGIVRAMHVEGGPEASLSIRAGSLRLDLAGSFETGFLEDETNLGQWALPNVIGIGAKR